MSDYRTVDAKRPWAALIAYSRAVRRGNIIEVGGTSATLADGTVVGPGDAYTQTAHILKVIEEAINELGGSIKDVVRTRVYLTHMDDWEGVGRAHGQMFAGISPASTFVEVNRLILPELRVEIEATAIILTEANPVNV